LTITDRPEFDNYHANPDYLSGIRTEGRTVFLNIAEEKVSIPLVRRQLHGDFHDLFSPIGFQPFVNVKLWHELLLNMKEMLYRSAVVSLYILSRNDLRGISSPSGFNLERYRTNYYIDLGLSRNDWFDRLKRDARQRLRKALKLVEYDVEATDISDEFVENYLRIAEARGFSDNYRFDRNDFARINSADGVICLELRDSSCGDFIAGGIFGCYNGDVDYLFGADSANYRDAVRLLICEAREFFQRRGFSRLYLGGGIMENDSLAMFKERMGTERQYCSAIRAVINVEQAESLCGRKFSAEWFEGFFPPYTMEYTDEKTGLPACRIA